MKSFKITIITLLILFTTVSNLLAADLANKPLDVIFDNAVIFPIDYHDKLFVNGEKVDMLEKHKIIKINGNVMIPVKLMNYLVGQLDGTNWSWWQIEKPEDIILNNYDTNTTIKFKENSKVMYINKQPKTLEDPLQRIDGTVVISLNSIAQIFNKRIQLVNGLIVMSNDLLDIENPKTFELSEKIKAKLLDTRKEVPEQKQVRKIYSVNGDTVYYLKDYIIKGKSIPQIYKKSGNKKEFKVDFPVQANLGNSQVINNELYFVSKNKTGYGLDALNLITSKTKKVCNLGKWKPSDGWLGGLKYINNELYVVLHRGDLTMAEEELYKIKNGKLIKLTNARNFINYDANKEYLYYLDSTEFNMADNLYKLNMGSKKKSNIGNKGFSYGMSRKINHGGNTINIVGNLIIKDGYLFTLGYKESDQKAKSCVYKINLSTNTQIQVTPPATSFWIVDNSIYYLDFSTGNLAKIDLQGNNQKTLIGKRIINIKFYNGNFYYTADNGNHPNTFTGRLYKLNIKTGQEKQLSNQAIREFYVGKLGVYYKSDGYDLGLYKVDSSGKSICLVKDRINLVLLTDSGLAYTMRYKEGVYTAK